MACEDSSDVNNLKITVDGSSTVFPISEALAEAFHASERKKGNKLKLTIGVSGTGGGFKKFCRGEVVLTGASRPIKKSEIELCKKAGIEFVEIPVAYDGIAVVAHKDNAWAKTLTVNELKKMWEPEAGKTITHWNQIRADFPATELHLYGPGVDSGTYDYFTKAIVGQEHASRGDFTSSEDDNVLVHGIKGDPGALGFFGFAYYKENQDVLSIVAVDDEIDTNGKGGVAASAETVKDGTYQPLSRPIFWYARKKALQNISLKRFLDFAFDEGNPLITEVGYIPLSDEAIAAIKGRINQGVTGSLFRGAASGVSVEKVLGL